MKIEQELKGKIQLIMMSLDYLERYNEKFLEGKLTKTEVENITGCTTSELQELKQIFIDLRNCNGIENFPKIPNWALKKLHFYNLLFSKL